MAHSVDLTSAYVPSLMVRRFTDDPRALSTPEALPVDGAALFADIVGFTALTAQLGQQGAEGAEHLTAILNAYFGRLVDLIGSHGGEPVEFFGDALLSFWPAGDAGLAEATLRAISCGMAVQRELDAYPAAPGIELSLHVVIGAGRAVSAAIGGSEGRWHFVLAGEPLQQIAVNEGQAGSGEVVVSREAWRLVEDRVSGTERDHGFQVTDLRDAIPAVAAVVPEISDEVGALLRPYIPDAVQARIDAGLGEWLGELRLVTAMFVNLLDFDQSSPDALSTVHMLVEAVQSVLARFDGTLKNLSAGDKGSVLIAVFGTPPRTHEDDAARCTKVALEIRTQLAARGHRSAIGIATGRVFCGPLGSASRRVYTVIGDAMNLAARLMGQAGDGILVDEATVRAARERVVFQALPPVAVKGREEPIPVYRPIREHRRDPRERRDELFGREAELAQIRTAIDRLATDGVGGVVVIEGEAGIGKSSLLSHLRRQAEDLLLPVREGAGDPIDRGTPYHAWRDIVSGMLDLPAFADAGLRERRVAELLGPDLAEMGPLLNAIVPLGLPDNETTRLLEGQNRTERTRSLVVRAIEHASGGGPYVILLEDGHWFDDASWELVHTVSSRTENVLLVVTTRPEGDGVPSRALRMLDVAATDHVLLFELTAADTANLVAQRLGVSTIPREVEDLIGAKAEGHPLYAEELAFTLRDRHLISTTGGICTLEPDVDLDAVELPDTLQGIITSRIDQMTPQQQLTLKVASVLGTTFHLDVLHDVFPVASERDEFLPMLQAMAQTNLVQPEPGAGPDDWAFRHALTRDATYELLLYAQRRELHAAVAAWYERLPDTSPYYTVLAHHWIEAGDTMKGVEYLTLESHRLNAAGLSPAAVEVGLDALGLLGEELPRSVPEVVAQLQVQLELALGSLAGRDVEDLKELPLLTDPVVATKIATMLGILPSTFQCNQQELFALITLRALNLTLEAGHFPASPLVYAMYSVVCRNLLGDSRTAYRFGRLALELNPVFGDQVLTPCGFVHYWFQDHWVNPLRTSLDPVRSLTEAAWKVDDWEYGRYLLSMELIHSANSGDPLDSVISRGRECIPVNGNMVLQASFHLYHELQYAKALAGLTDHPLSLSDEEYDEERHVRWILTSELANQIGYLHVYDLRLRFLYREIEEALACADRASAVLSGFAGQYVEAEYVLFHAMSLLARAATTAEPERSELLARVGELRLRLSAWSDDCPENFHHMVLLVDAELDRLDGGRSWVGYADAAEAAERQGLIQHAALAHECAGRAAAASGDMPAARAAYQRAAERYRTWGAHAKVADLEAQLSAAVG